MLKKMNTMNSMNSVLGSVWKEVYCVLCPVSCGVGFVLAKHRLDRCVLYIHVHCHCDGAYDGDDGSRTRIHMSHRPLAEVCAATLSHAHGHGSFGTTLGRVGRTLRAVRRGEHVDRRQQCVQHRAVTRRGAAQRCDGLCADLECTCPRHRVYGSVGVCLTKESRSAQTKHSEERAATTGERASQALAEHA